MIVSTLLAAGLATASPLQAPSAAMHCNPQPSKSLGCNRHTTPARTASADVARDCHAHPGKSHACLGRQQSGEAAKDALASRGKDKTYD